MRNSSRELITPVMRGVMPSGNAKEKEDELSRPWGDDHEAHHARDQGAMKHHARDEGERKRKRAASDEHGLSHGRNQALGPSSCP